MSNETNFLRNDERTNAIFDFIVKHKIQHDGVAPSIREISAECGGISTSVVRYHLDKLADEGRIIEERGEDAKARMIRVPGYSWCKDDKQLPSTWIIQGPEGYYHTNIAAAYFVDDIDNASTFCKTHAAEMVRNLIIMIDDEFVMQDVGPGECVICSGEVSE